MNPGDGLPPFGVVQQALRRTTEHLARELHAPTTATPDWSDFEWRIARAVATMQGIAGLLASRLTWRGPSEFHAFLFEQRAQIAGIQEKVRRRLARIDFAARASGIGCVALKGAALLALGVPGRGERPMGDIDLLVRPADVDAMGRLLATLGYVPEQFARRHHTFVPGGLTAAPVPAEHRHNPLRVEVHSRITEELPLDEVEITAALWPARLQLGINAYPCTSSLMRHLLLHAAGNMRARALRQVQLHDVEQLARRMTPDGWRELLAGERGRADWWLYPALWFTQCQYPGSLPTAVVAAARSACPRLLRFSSERQVLADVSWANARVEALPGIEWARTPLEAARYARSRAMPSRRTLQEVSDMARTQPHLRFASWYQLPHARRVLRWLTGPVPRAHTLRSVRAALGAPADV